MAKKAKVGAAAGIAMAAAAGAYFLYGKDAEKHRKKVKGWALKAKGEILDKVENLKEVNRDNYNAVVDQVAKRYKEFKKTDSKELKKLVKEVKGYWNQLAKKAKTVKKSVNGAKKKASRKKTKKA